MDKIMKTQTKITPITSGFNPTRPRTDTRRISFRSFLPAALMAGAALLGLGVDDVHAQVPCTPGTQGGLFEQGITAGPANDPTPSMGGFQIYVLSEYASGNNDLFDPGTVGLSSYPAAYPGWSAGTISTCIGCPGSGLAGWLTSPVIYDLGNSGAGGTVIGRSAPHQRPTPFPVTIGANGTGNADTLVGGYGANYVPGYPLSFFGLPGTWEILTEIEHFTLSLPANATNCGCNPSLNVPCPTLTTAYPMV